MSVRLRPVTLMELEQPLFRCEAFLLMRLYDNLMRRDAGRITLQSQQVLYELLREQLIHEATYGIAKGN